ncbi:MAG: DUF1092 family protein, partial [Synechococcales cyanobacterium RM1_1_8]|nr:DUF1092 family protein [Synechococcales cyanobacterium RM1_1_8]
RPQTDAQGRPLWELLLCDRQGWQFSRRAPQAEISGDWVRRQLEGAIAHQAPPKILQVFRPQSFSLIAAAAGPLKITVEATRRTPQLKALLLSQAESLAQAESQVQAAAASPWNPLEIEQLPPQPLPERLRGERWQFAALAAGEVDYAFRDRPIPILSVPDHALPIPNGLASDVPVPGLVIYGGRSAMALARWLHSCRPVLLKYIAGAPDGVILEAGLAERWVMATFGDREVAVAAEGFERRKRAAQGIHFLSIQPDDSGVTASGFWLLRAE